MKNTMLVLANLATFVFALMCTLVIIASITFEINCGSFLKRAGDANTVELAQKEISKVIKYIERNGMTEGRTNVLWYTPAYDLGFWYTNLNSAYQELCQVSSEATQLEKSNMLMKLRETLLDDTGEGVAVTTPPNISLYPLQRLFHVLLWLSVIGLVVFWILFIWIIGIFS